VQLRCEVIYHPPHHEMFEWYNVSQISVFAKQGEFMATTSVKVSAKYQIAVPQIVRKKLNIKKGDRLLVDVQDGMIVLIPEPKRYSDYLQGLHGEIWKGTDVQKYINAERDTWKDPENG
jgi:AbrB family looped-hinge helix DNA binding protein